MAKSPPPRPPISRSFRPLALPPSLTWRQTYRKRRAERRRIKQENDNGPNDFMQKIEVFFSHSNSFSFPSAPSSAAGYNVRAIVMRGIGRKTAEEGGRKKSPNSAKRTESGFPSFLLLSGGGQASQNFFCLIRWERRGRAPGLL